VPIRRCLFFMGEGMLCPKKLLLFCNRLYKPHARQYMRNADIAPGFSIFTL
jgi:hypothetical protein